jgi:mono/diheme cytochrome c family protein
MRSSGSLACVLGLVGGLVVHPVVAAGQSDDPAVRRVSGSYVFRTYCASCHGAKGAGDGPLAESLRFVPPDLTRIAQRNQGEFPAEEVFRIIDGRKPVPGHGGPDMPVWGDAFKNTESGFDEEHVKAKIQALVDHIKMLQVK